MRRRSEGQHQKLYVPNSRVHSHGCRCDLLFQRKYTNAQLRPSALQPSRPPPPSKVLPTESEGGYDSIARSYVIGQCCQAFKHNHNSNQRDTCDKTVDGDTVHPCLSLYTPSSVVSGSGLLHQDRDPVLSRRHLETCTSEPSEHLRYSQLTW